MLMYPLGRKRRTRRQQHWLLAWCVVPFTGCILLLDRNAHPVGISPVGVSVFNMNFKRHFIFPQCPLMILNSARSLRKIAGTF